MSLTPEQIKYFELLKSQGSVKRAYRKFLNSRCWKEQKKRKKDSVLSRCQRCGLSESLEVHHINYRFLFDCTNEDLELICYICHKNHHQKDFSVKLEV
jgi:hypothetical protein